jgi:hypothetical protein
VIPEPTTLTGAAFRPIFPSAGGAHAAKYVAAKVLSVARSLALAASKYWPFNATRRLEPLEATNEVVGDRTIALT